VLLFDQGGVVMTARIYRFPPRQSQAIWLSTNSDGWIVQAGSHGWSHGDHHSAIEDAHWLGENMGLPVRATFASSL
jgi:hypothetical protein